VVYEDGEVGFAIDTLPRDGRPKEWERTTHQICKILKREVERLPVETKRLSRPSLTFCLENRSSSSRSRPG